MNLERIDLWERIEQDGNRNNISTARLAVTGGWLYRVTMNSTVGPGVAVTTTFVADPDAEKTAARRMEIEEQRIAEAAARHAEWRARQAKKSGGVQ